MNDRFLQIHFLTSYPAALLNRDDAGFAKRIPFGGVSRTRISSQCLKRHWRTASGEHALANLHLEPTIRSRHTFQKYLLTPLTEATGNAELAEAATTAIMQEVLGESPKAKDKKGKGKKTESESSPADAPSTPISVQTSQVTVLGKPELEYLLDIAKRVCSTESDPKKCGEALKKILGKDGKENLKTMRRAAGLDAALFGRMVTGDILARGDAAIHVAHAFTVHAEAAEADYFSALDDLQAEMSGDQPGSGHINTAELTSGLYYGYVVIDVPLLISNLEGCPTGQWLDADHTLAAKVLTRLIHLVATVSPGARLGATAPYGYASLLLIEMGKAQPRSLANAFLAPVRERPDVLTNTMGAMARHLASLDAMYGRTFARAFAGIQPHPDWTEPLVGKSLPLEALAAWATVDHPAEGV